MYVLSSFTAVLATFIPFTFFSAGSLKGKMDDKCFNFARVRRHYTCNHYKHDMIDIIMFLTNTHEKKNLMV